MKKVYSSKQNTFILLQDIQQNWRLENMPVVVARLIRYFVKLVGICK